MIRRTYFCEDCRQEFTVSCRPNDPDPRCPNKCDVVMQWRPGSFAIGTHKGKAVDVTQKILEEDYGLSNFNDRNREGDIAAKMPVETTTQREAREMAEQALATVPKLTPDQQKVAAGFFAGTPASAPPQLIETFKAGAKVGPAADVDPMAMLHKAGKKRQIPRSYVALTEKGAQVRSF